MVLRLLVVCDIVSHWPVFTSVDEAVSGAGSAPAAPVTALSRLITAASRKRRDAAGTH
jgi:hypothetical protein